MPLLDLESIIERENIKSRFRLVRIAGLRSRELNDSADETMSRQNQEHHKVTTTALAEILDNSIEIEKLAKTEED